MLYFRSDVDSLFTVSVIVASVDLDPVALVTLNIGIAVELDLILAVLIKSETVVIELVGPFLDSDHLAVELELALIIDGHQAVAAFKVCMPLMILAGEISVVDHVEAHD